jgi:hypothetical protein
MGTELDGLDLTNYLRAVSKATGETVTSVEDLSKSDLEIAEAVVKDVRHAGFQPLEAVQRFGRWLSGHFPEMTAANDDPLVRAMELLQAMQHRLESVSLLAGSPVRVGPWAVARREDPMISDEDLAGLARRHHGT